MCYANKWNISAGIIVAGYDSLNGGSVYSIPSGGSCVKLDYALGGSGSIFLYSFFDANYKPGMTKEECVRFCQTAVAHAYSRDGSSGGLIRTICLSAGEPEDITVPWTKTPYCMEKDPKYAQQAVVNPVFSSSAKITENKVSSTA
ncbi:20S proteasome subunit beta 1 [Angomonas deanei]|nr:20S proteasome subunit beta 1 [Angomonas deanei]|eukprot:EPY40467.1 20S proteasome subunit beta 1 [Angomonas deanei]